MAKLVDRAIALHQRNELRKAEALYRQVLASDPRELDAWHLLGALLLETERPAEAVNLLESAIRRSPRQAVFYANLGEALRRVGRLDEAKANLERAIALAPALAEPHSTLGLVLSAMGRLVEAIGPLERAASLKPSLTNAHVALATVFQDLGRLDSAAACCAWALEVDPGCADAHNRLGCVLAEQGSVAEALESFSRALACQPGHATAHSNIVFSLAFDPGATAETILAEGRRWAEAHAPSDAGRPPSHANDRNPERRLRVGYVSPDFRRHPNSLYFVPLLEQHDRSAMEVFCYSLVSRPDDMTARIRDSADAFRTLTRASDTEALACIREDRVDVLVDLAMHMGDNRLQLFASKPAPVQVAWLAYPGTTGLEAIDYRISDPHLDPPGLDVSGLYAEKTVRLPDSFWGCYDPGPMVRGLDVGPLPALDAGHVTFASFNSYKKTNPELFALWADVLRAVGGSRLLLLAPAGRARDGARRAFARAGIAPERVEFVEAGRPQAEYFARYHRADVCLDTLPYNGHTTTLDALWMGVPVVTLVGSTIVGRAGLCYARNLGLEELVAATPEQFVAIAAELARDLPRLARLRAELRGRMERSPLMDAGRFARNLESAFRGMWRRWCETAPSGDDEPAL